MWSQFRQKQLFEAFRHLSDHHNFPSCKLFLKKYYRYRGDGILGDCNFNEITLYACCVKESLFTLCHEFCHALQFRDGRMILAQEGWLVFDGVRYWVDFNDAEDLKNQSEFPFEIEANEFAKVWTNKLKV